VVCRLDAFERGAQERGHLRAVLLGDALEPENLVLDAPPLVLGLAENALSLLARGAGQLLELRLDRATGARRLGRGAGGALAVLLRLGEQPAGAAPCLAQGERRAAAGLLAYVARGSLRRQQRVAENRLLSLPGGGLEELRVLGRPFVGNLVLDVGVLRLRLRGERCADRGDERGRDRPRPPFPLLDREDAHAEPLGQLCLRQVRLVPGVAKRRRVERRRRCVRSLELVLGHSAASRSILHVRARRIHPPDGEAARSTTLEVCRASKKSSRRCARSRIPSSGWTSSSSASSTTLR